MLKGQKSGSQLVTWVKGPNAKVFMYCILFLVNMNVHSESVNSQWIFKFISNTVKV